MTAFVGPAARELERRGHQVEIVATDLALAPGARPQRSIRAEEIHPDIAAVRHSLYRTRWPRRLLFSPGLARAARAAARSTDIVHIHSLWLHPQYATYTAAVAQGVPYIVSPHGALDPYLRSRGRLRKRITTELWQQRMLERASVMHVTTDVEAQLVADIAPEVPRVVVPVGIDLRKFRDLPSSDEFRKTRLDGYDGPVVLFFGRLTYKKGVDLLIEGFAQLRSEMPCRLVLAGPDDERLTPSLEALVERHGLHEDVVFTGPLFGEDRLGALAAADVWALTSHTENFGVAVVEAMAAGCAIVISPAVNLAPAIAAAGAGVVADLHEDAIADALRSVLTDAEHRDELRGAARRFAERYELQRVVNDLERMYLGACRSPQARGDPLIDLSR